jgi:hypothetical protein
MPCGGTLFFNTRALEWTITRHDLATEPSSRFAWTDPHAAIPDHGTRILLPLCMRWALPLRFARSQVFVLVLAVSSPVLQALQKSVPWPSPPGSSSTAAGPAGTGAGAAAGPAGTGAGAVTCARRYGCQPNMSVIPQALHPGGEYKASLTPPASKAPVDPYTRRRVQGFAGPVHQDHMGRPQYYAL